VLWRLAVGTARGWDASQGAKLGAAAALAFLAKASAVPVVGALVVAALWTLVRGGARGGIRGGSRDRIVAVAAAVIAAGVVVLPWFLFLRAKYGTFLPWADPEFDAIVASLPALPRLRLFDGSLAASRIADADTWWKLVGGPWMVTSVKSSLGKFGWMDRPLPLWHYAGLLVVWGAGAAGLLRGVLAAARARRRPAGSAILVACGAASILQLAASVNYSLRWDYQAQGRYLFPAILCAAVLAAFGFGRLVPAPHRVVAARIAVLLCAVLSFAAFPYAYGPLPAR
jgi:hypothetical protein